MTHDLETLIDRIAYDDATPAGLRQALPAIEAADAWKPLALALLEARGLDEAFRRPAEPEVTLTTATKPAAEPPRRAWKSPLAAAACALVAFAAGWFANGRPGPMPPRAPEVVVREVPAASTVASSTRADAPKSGKADPIKVPSWVVRQPMPVADDTRAALLARGYQLEQQRRLVSGRLPDGRQVVVPVDRVGVRYVGGDTL